MTCLLDTSVWVAFLRKPNSLVVPRLREAARRRMRLFRLQIAAIALANGCSVVTHNTEEFRRIPGLVLEDWQQP